MKTYTVYHPNVIKARVSAESLLEAEAIVTSYLDDPYSHADDQRLEAYIDLRVYGESCLSKPGVRALFQ